MPIERMSARDYDLAEEPRLLPRRFDAPRERPLDDERGQFVDKEK